MRSAEELIAEMKSHPDYPKAGMILCHNGVVRESSRDGKPVRGLSVEVNQEKLEEILAEQRKRDGIIDIIVEINEGSDLKIGDDVMFIVVAGDIRETVIASLTDTLNSIKEGVTKKTEFFI